MNESRKPNKEGSLIVASCMRMRAVHTHLRLKDQLESAPKDRSFTINGRVELAPFDHFAITTTILSELAMAFELAFKAYFAEQKSPAGRITGHSDHRIDPRTRRQRHAVSKVGWEFVRALGAENVEHEWFRFVEDAAATKYPTWTPEKGPSPTRITQILSHHKSWLDNGQSLRYGDYSQFDTPSTHRAWSASLDSKSPCECHKLSAATDIHNRCRTDILNFGQAIRGFDRSPASSHPSSIFIHSYENEEDHPTDYDKRDGYFLFNPMLLSRHWQFIVQKTIDLVEDNAEALYKKSNFDLANTIRVEVGAAIAMRRLVEDTADLFWRL